MRKEWESHDQPERDNFWSADETLGPVQLYGEVFSARLRAHLAEEPYVKRRDVVPLRAPRGICDYVLIHPYILLPDVSLRVDLYPSRSDGIADGEVVSSDWWGMRHERIGDGQAWFYRDDQTVVLWECMLLRWHRAEDPSRDANLRTLWTGFERFLQRRFPTAERIVTSREEPEYEPAQWERFLSSLGYRRLDEQAYGKELRSAS